MDYLSLDKSELIKEREKLQKDYDAFKAQGLSLNMARGKPCTEQLDLSMAMLDTVNAKSEMLASTGDDCRNYGLPDGLPELREIFAAMMEVPADNVLIGGNSSLNMMFDTVACGMTHGFSGCEPWSRQKAIKFLCPAPGYDRHFAVTGYFGAQLVSVNMTPEGPDMDQVEELIQDPAVKGIWCVPKYSNPQGYTYSDETVRRFAALKPAARDFRIFWDNAYCVHELSDTPDTLLSLWEECKKAGSEDLAFYFSSMSKITFPGSGVAAMAASGENLKVLREHFSFQTIGRDKLSQLRHVKFLKNIDGVHEQMKKHRTILEPKFQVVLEKLRGELGGLGVARWTEPHGGYFISVDVMEGCAKRVVSLCKEAGVILTGAGAAFPYGNDQKDENIRVAPTYPSVEELKKAMDLFCICVKLAAAEKLLEK